MKHKLCVIGYGGMGGYHAKQLLSLPEEFRLAGIYDINPERIAAAEQDGRPRDGTEFSLTIR